MKDSGERQEFETGSMRDTDEGKPRPDLISPFLLLRLGHVLAKGAKKYGERNWELGQPMSRYLASHDRHMLQWRMGEVDEDHLAQAAFNLMGLIHMEEMSQRSLSMRHLNDLPTYYKLRVGTFESVAPGVYDWESFPRGIL